MTFERPQVDIVPISYSNPALEIPVIRLWRLKCLGCKWEDIVKSEPIARNTRNNHIINGCLKDSGAPNEPLS